MVLVSQSRSEEGAFGESVLDTIRDTRGYFLFLECAVEDELRNQNHRRRGVLVCEDGGGSEGGTDG